MEPTSLLDRLLRQFPSAKRRTLKRMVEEGRVRVNGQRAMKLKQELSGEDRVEVSDRRSVQPPGRERSLKIIYEDDDILVGDKPAGLLTSTVPREKRPTLLALVRERVAQQNPRATVGLIHRLDRDASGLLVFSLNDDAYRSLKTQFFHHTVTREYRALVHGVPDPSAGRIETRLIERADGTVHSTRQIGKGQIAVTEYEVLASARKRGLLRVALHTGRKHQIRVHLAERGNPIVGDRVYGPDTTAPRLMLAATRLTLIHPRSNSEMTFTIPIPPEFEL